MNLSSGTQSLIAGAIFDFMGYLTTRPNILETGAAKNAQPILEELKVWAAKRGLGIEKAMVRSWDTLSGEVTLASLTGTGGVERRRIAGALMSYVDYLQVAETEDYEGALLRWASKTGLEISNPQDRWASLWWA